MLEEMKKLCLAAVGAAAITYDKTIDIINDLVEKGKITVEEGKELSEELKKNITTKAGNDCKDADRRAGNRNCIYRAA